MRRAIVSGSFDDLRSKGIRFLHEASRLGALRVLLWSDHTVRAATGAGPKFPVAERAYLVRAIRYVADVVTSGEQLDPNRPADSAFADADLWVVSASNVTDRARSICERMGIELRVIPDADLRGFPRGSLGPGAATPKVGTPRARRVVVTGCYDWFHSGHVRFFEEVSQLGELYVVVGHDANVRLLKGEGHPFFPAEERRYMVQSVRHVTEAFVSTGDGWMDAAPEIERIAPDMYAVNEDGDKPEKREFCEERGIRYVVLKRTPKEGLTRRSSTDLRGY